MDYRNSDNISIRTVRKITPYLRAIAAPPGALTSPLTRLQRLDVSGIALSFMARADGATLLENTLADVLAGVSSTLVELSLDACEPVERALLSPKFSSLVKLDALSFRKLPTSEPMSPTIIAALKKCSRGTGEMLALDDASGDGRAASTGRKGVRQLTLRMIDEGAVADIVSSELLASFRNEVEFLFVEDRLRCPGQARHIVAHLITAFANIRTLRIKGSLEKEGALLVLSRCRKLEDVQLDLVFSNPWYSETLASHNFEGTVQGFGPLLSDFVYCDETILSLSPTVQICSRLRSLNLDFWTDEVGKLAQIIINNRALHRLRAVFYVDMNGMDPDTYELVHSGGWSKLADAIGELPSLRDITFDDRNAGYSDRYVRDFDEDLFLISEEEETEMLDSMERIIESMGTSARRIEFRMLTSRNAFENVAQASIRMLAAAARSCPDLEVFHAHFCFARPSASYQWAWGSDATVRDGLRRLQDAERLLRKRAKNLSVLDIGYLTKEASFRFDDFLDRYGSIVWDYFTPDRGGAENELVRSRTPYDLTLAGPGVSSI